jgi:hypothetical protein
MRLRLAVLLLFVSPLACASAQSLCDVLPAAEVKATLGLAGNLTPKPDTDGGNGCDYSLDTPGNITVMADVSDYTSMLKTLTEQTMAHLSGTQSKLPALGDVAYYDLRDNWTIPKYRTMTFTQQSISFVAKGKLVSFIIVTVGKGAPKDAVVALGKLTIAKPIEKLKDPN